jgi:hypothetical protein
VRKIEPLIRALESTREIKKLLDKENDMLLEKNQQLLHAKDLPFKERQASLDGLKKKGEVPARREQSAREGKQASSEGERQAGNCRKS